MSVIKEKDRMVNDYFISEGNKLGTLPTEFGEGVTLVEKSIKAGTDVKKGQVVEITDDLKVGVTSAASAKVIGVAMFDAKIDEDVAVECEGLFKLTASGSITAGDKVDSAADGKVATSAGENAIGIALNTATDSNPVYVKFSI